MQSMQNKVAADHYFTFLKQQGSCWQHKHALVKRKLNGYHQLDLNKAHA